MRLREVHLIAYGPFTDQRIDLSAGEHGLHLVYGPNEAGKSAALRAIHALLFGIPARTEDDFVHDYGSLAVGGTISDPEHGDLAFTRKKGNKNTVLKPDGKGEAYPDEVLARFTTGIDGATFEQIFGINQERLRAGGEALKALRGLVGETLITASGGVAVREVLESLEEDAKRLYKTRGKSEISQAIAAYRDAQKRSRAASVPHSRWSTLQHDLEAVQRERDAHGDEIKKLRSSKDFLGRVQSSLEFVVERKDLVAEIDRMHDVRVLPDAYSAEERRDRQRALGDTRTAIARLERELDGDGGIRGRIRDLEPPEELLAQADRTNELYQRSGEYRKAVRDLPKRQAEMDDRERRARGILRELSPELPWSEVESLRLAAERKVRIQALGAEQQSMHERPRELEKALVELDLEIEQKTQVLADLEEPADPAALRRALARTAKQGDLEDQLASARQEARLGLARATDRLGALGLWRGALEDLASLPVPTSETVERYQEIFGGIETEEGRLSDREVDARDRTARATQQIEALRGERGVPTEDDLASARERRDHGWELIKGAWIDGVDDEASVRDFSGEDDLTIAYEESVSDADVVADRLRREADRVATLARHQAELADCERQREELVQQRGELDDRLGEVRRDWSAVWEPANVDAPLSPREMLAWLRRYEVARLAAEGARDLHHEVDRLESAVEAQRSELGQKLVALGESASAEGETLASLVDRCEAVVSNIDAAVRERADLKRDIAKLEAERKRRGPEKRRAEEALEQWSARWSVAIGVIGCEAGATAAEANARIARLDELFVLIDGIDELRTRMSKIGADIEAFERDVREVCGHVAPDLEGTDALVAAAELFARTQKGAEDAAALKELREREQEKAAALADAEASAEELIALLDAMCRSAGVEDHDHLEEVEKLSRAVTDARDRLDQIDVRLRGLAGERMLADFVVEAEKHEYADLTAQLAEIDDEMERLETARADCDRRLGELGAEMGAIDGSAEAAEADEEALGLLARIRDHAARFVRLRIAATALRRQVEAHRDANQDPMISRAGELFSRLTCTRYSGLGTAYDDNDKPIVVGLRQANGEPLRVEQMSDGTRDQLFLAMRIAYLERRLEGRTVLPFIVDDILVSFDDRRTAATFEVLADLSRRTQVIFFTHHEHLVGLLEGTLPEGVRFVQRLPGP